MNTEKAAGGAQEVGEILPDGAQAAIWHSEAGFTAPATLEYADDTMRADQALKKMRNGIGLVWRGDFHNGRQLLQALGRRLDKKSKAAQARGAEPIAERFHRYRMQQAQRARLLGLLIIRLESDNTIALRRAPAWEQALLQVYGAAHPPMLVSLRELLGVVGAYEWRRKGVPIADCDFRIHPHYGVFSPSRAEYLALLMQAPLPEKCRSAFDIGTGTGVLSVLLAKRGILRIIATDSSPRAVACAQDNVDRLGLNKQVIVQEVAFFPEGRADLLVCNPPWLPGKVTSSLDAAVYDPNEQMLKGFLQQARHHLEPGGQIWLIMSDLAQLLGLRAEGELTQLFSDYGLRVL
ncbi:MAG TPA: class I SAM-dependent methyltransferase, partial [Advenella sp.]|nr:class I SAM-dependent methyltransferase [Advenella sp.]